jgi:carboxyl-terminal processing protease
MKTERALEIILGKVGVPITLVVEREGEDGKTERKEFALERGLVSVETVLGVKRDEKDDWDFYIDPEKKIGYVCLTQFSPNTAVGLDSAIKKLQKTGLNGLVLDLRFNPGGLLTQAVAVSDLFLETDKPIVTVRYRYKPEEPWFDQGLRTYTGFPVVVLVNGSSASAAEIVSACLRDDGRAKVAGERTYGKGSVQKVFNLSNKDAVKLTTEKWLTPAGKNIHRWPDSKEADEWGVRPDPGLEVPVTADLSAELGRWADVHALRPAESREALPFDDPAKDPFRLAALAHLRKVLEKK